MKTLIAAFHVDPLLRVNARFTSPIEIPHYGPLKDFDFDYALNFLFHGDLVSPALVSRKIKKKNSLLYKLYSDLFLNILEIQSIQAPLNGDTQRFENG